MKAYLILFWMVLLTFNIGKAHNPNEAFFVVTEVKGGIEIEAEFPWSIRNALLVYRPELNDERDKSKFEQAFFEYIREQLVLTDITDEIMELKEVRTLNHQGHTHQNKVMLIYEGKKLKSIQNRIMFNIYENQVNYLKLEQSDDQLFHLTIDNDTLDLEQSNSNVMRFLMYITFIIITMLLIIKRINNKTSVLELKY